MTTFQINPNVESIIMPENLRVGLMVAQHRKMCEGTPCPFDYAGLAFGQSPFHVPPPLARALGEHAEKGHYSAAEGITELRTAIAGFNKRYFDLDVEPSRIVVGPGTKDLIFTIFSMLTGHVIIPSPSWIGYFPQLKLIGKDYHTYHLKPENDYKIIPSELDSYLFSTQCDNEQHLLVLNNPNNPTGVVYTRNELARIADVCKKHNTMILADEIYALSTYDYSEFVSMGTIYPEGTFVTNGLSKDRSAGGYRLGACILPEQDSEELQKNFTKMAATVYTNVSTPTQYAAITAYEPNEEIDEYFLITRNIHRMMGLFMSDQFNQIAGVRATTPRGGFYFYADFNQLAPQLRSKGVMTSNDLGHSMLAHPFHIATVTGDAVMLQPDDYGARIAFVDYNGKETFENYQQTPPESKEEEHEFVKRNAPKMVDGVEKLKQYVAWLKE